MADKLGTLPTLNAIMDKAFRVPADDSVSFHDLFNVMRYDQAISSKIISVANSAYCCRGSQIVSLERAMMAVGIDEVRRIVMCLVFLREILSPWKLSQSDLTSLRSHTVSVACAAKNACRKNDGRGQREGFHYLYPARRRQDTLLYLWRQVPRDTGRGASDESRCLLHRKGGLRYRSRGTRSFRVGEIEFPEEWASLS